MAGFFPHRGLGRLAPSVLVVAAMLAVAPMTVTAPPAAADSEQSSRVLLVGTWHGHRGQFQSIQDAVNAARPGDWILVGPGDYRESPNSGNGVWITTPHVHVRGMDRNRVVVDGTKPGDTPPCSSLPSAQNFGASGRNGLTVYKANGDSIENLTACNFESSAGGGGNEIWFNGGDGSGQQNLGSFHGAYLTATSTYTANDANLAQYGIFVSNSYGPGRIVHSYANNMADASFYVGACPNCNVVLDHDVGEHSVLGYSGTNAGGNLIIENSTFADNSTGIAPNSLNNDDAPPPQNGACPNGGTGPYGTRSCTVIRGNFVVNNNDPNVPGGQPGGGTHVMGVGIVLGGGQNDLAIHNLVFNNGSWGILTTDYPDTETPPPLSHCQGGVNLFGVVCDFPALGNEIKANLLGDNGFFGNPTNADLGDNTLSHDPGNCWLGNERRDEGQTVTSDPPNIQVTHSNCGVPNSGDLNGPLSVEVACASQALGPCGGGGEATVVRRDRRARKAARCATGGLGGTWHRQDTGQTIPSRPMSMPPIRAISSRWTTPAAVCRTTSGAGTGPERRYCVPPASTVPVWRRATPRP